MSEYDRNRTQGVWKVIKGTKAPAGFIPNQPPDEDSDFIHACEYEKAHDVIRKFFKDQQVAIIEIDVAQAIRDGFIVKYEADHPGDTKYWHFYRENTLHLLSYGIYHRGAVWKIIDKKERDGQYIPNQSADEGKSYIVARDPWPSDKMYDNLVNDRQMDTVIFAIDVAQAIREGFVVKYEPIAPDDSGETHVWRFYRSSPSHILSGKCVTHRFTF